MYLLDDVWLIESEVLTLPTASTFEHSITKQASYEHSDSWTKLCNSMIGSHHWKKTGKIADLFDETLFGQGQESEPSVEHRSIEYSRSRAAGYPKIGW